MRDRIKELLQEALGYAMAKKDNTNESIENWEAYHKVVKPKYTEFVKESKYFKTKK
jgi:hypothetical protein